MSSIREEYLEWHKSQEFTQARILCDKRSMDKMLQFTDAFMERGDRLERKVNDLSRDNRDLKRIIRTLNEGRKLL